MTIVHRDLFAIQRAFFALAPPGTLTFPEHIPLEVTHDFLLALLLSTHLREYPPSIQYQKRFWKWGVENLEKYSEKDHLFEIDEQIYEYYLSLLPPSSPAPGASFPELRARICERGVPMQPLPPSPSYITHYYNFFRETNASAPTDLMIDTTKYHTATLLESRSTIESGTTGMRTWLASHVLSQYLLSHSELVKHKRILELGSGSGFLAIIIASIQCLSMHQLQPSSSIWLTDVSDLVLSRCRDNVNLPCNLSKSHPNISYRLIDWFSALDETTSSGVQALLQEKINPDLILGADLLYDLNAVPAVVKMIQLGLQTTATDPKPKLALLALTVRNEDTVTALIRYAHASALNITEISFGYDRTTVYEGVEGSRTLDKVKIMKITL